MQPNQIGDASRRSTFMIWNQPLGIERGNFFVQGTGHVGVAKPQMDVRQSQEVSQGASPTFSTQLKNR